MPPRHGGVVRDELRKLDRLLLRTNPASHRLPDLPGSRAGTSAAALTEAGCKIIGERPQRTLRHSGWRLGAVTVASCALYVSGGKVWDGFWAQPAPPPPERHLLGVPFTPPIRPFGEGRSCRQARASKGRPRQTEDTTGSYKRKRLAFLTTASVPHLREPVFPVTSSRPTTRSTVGRRGSPLVWPSPFSCACPWCEPSPPFYGCGDRSAALRRRPRGLTTPRFPQSKKAPIPSRPPCRPSAWRARAAASWRPARRRPA